MLAPTPEARLAAEAQAITARQIVEDGLADYTANIMAEENVPALSAFRTGWQLYLRSHDRWIAKDGGVEAPADAVRVVPIRAARRVSMANLR